MVRLLVILLSSAILTFPVHAQESGAEVPFPDEMYVTNYFGTETIVFTTQKLEFDENDWWGSKMPEELLYDASYIVGMINGQRVGRGDTNLLDPNEYLIDMVWDEGQTDGGYEYRFKFIGFRPSEVDMVFAVLGGMAELIPGAQVTHMPLLERNFYATNSSLDADLELSIGSAKLTIPAGTPFKSIQKLITDTFNSEFDTEVILDIYYDQYVDRGGSSGATVSIYAILPAG